MRFTGKWGLINTQQNHTGSAFTTFPPLPPTTSNPRQKARMPSASIFSNPPTTYSTGACLAHFLDKYIGNGESRVWGTIKGKFIIGYTSPVLLIDYLESRLPPHVHLRWSPPPHICLCKKEPGEERSSVSVVLSFPWEIKLHAQSCKDGHLGQTEAHFIKVQLGGTKEFIGVFSESVGEVLFTGT